jgi:hypothetical protein
MRKFMVSEYLRLRAAGWHAPQALSTARTNFAFRRREAAEHCREGDKWNCVRLRYAPDESACLEDLEGDCFNPKVNPDIQASRLERERKAFVERVEREGVFGIIAEYWCEVSQSWKDCDSVWGFIGDDLHGNGYDSDLKRAALNARLRSVLDWRAINRESPAAAAIVRRVQQS